jgi:hypothetical protein
MDKRDINKAMCKLNLEIIWDTKVLEGQQDIYQANFVEKLI